MSKKPLVSICIPVLNGEPYLATALDSALAQSYANTEVVVVDNGSSDGTAQILERYQKFHGEPRLRCFRNESTVSMVENFNFAASQASGDYLKILPHDDVLTVDSIESLIREANPGDALIFGLRDFIFEDTGLRQRLFYRNQNIFWRADRKFGVGHITANHYLRVVAENCAHNSLGEPGSALISKSAFVASGGFHSAHHQLCDLRMWHALATEHGLRIVPKVVAHFRVHKNSESSRRRVFGESLLKEHCEISTLVHAKARAQEDARAIEQAQLNLLLDESRLQSSLGLGSSDIAKDEDSLSTMRRTANFAASLPVKRVYQLIVLKAGNRLRKAFSDAL